MMLSGFAFLATIPSLRLFDKSCVFAHMEMMSKVYTILKQAKGVLSVLWLEGEQPKDGGGY